MDYETIWNGLELNQQMVLRAAVNADGTFNRAISEDFLPRGLFCDGQITELARDVVAWSKMTPLERRQQAEIDRLRGALEFYALDDNYTIEYDAANDSHYTYVERDGGAIARAALDTDTD